MNLASRLSAPSRYTVRSTHFGSAAKRPLSAGGSGEVSASSALRSATALWNCSSATLNAAFGALAPRIRLPFWLAGLLTGVAAMFVGYFIVAPIKGNPIGGGWVASDGFQGLREIAGGRRGGRSAPRRGGLYSRSGFFSGGAYGVGGPPGRWSVLRAPVMERGTEEDLAESIAGVLASSAGYADSFHESLRFPLFVSAGTEDFNYREVHAVDLRMKTPHRVELFNGGHTWLPPDLATEGVEWMEVQAMKRGQRSPSW